MNARRCVAALVFSVCALKGAAWAQQPVGPVTPKPAQTPAEYAKALAGLLAADADDKLWDAMSPASRSQRLAAIERLSQGIINGLPIGPVTPKPPLPPPVGTLPPKPPAPPPVPPATKGQWEDALENLQGSLERAAKSNPGVGVNPGAAGELQSLIADLAKTR